MNPRRARELLHAAGLPFPAVVPSPHNILKDGWNVYSGTKLLGQGYTIDEAMDDARRYWDIGEYTPTQFRAEGFAICRSGVVEATAKSLTMARRIANALNVYNPDERKT